MAAGFGVNDAAQAPPEISRQDIEGNLKNRKTIGARDVAAGEQAFFLVIFSAIKCF